MKTVFAAYSKTHFYMRAHITKFVLDRGCAPFNPFMSFDYFLTDAVERDKVRAANNTFVGLCEELWVFGPVSDGVLSEIGLATQGRTPIHFFEIARTGDYQIIREIDRTAVTFEDGLDWLAT